MSNVSKNGPDVFCVIPTFNRVESLKNIIKLLDQQTYRSFKIIVVDDGSSDGTREYLEKLAKDKIIVLRGNGHLWWGGAAAMGIDYVVKNLKRIRFVLLLNDDSVVDANYLEEMVKDSENNNCAAVISPQCALGERSISFTGYKLSYKKLEFYQTKGKDIDATVGRGLLIPISIIHKVGNIKYHLFPHYMGDVEYTARIKEKGYPLVVSKNGKMYSDLNESDIDIQSRGEFVSYMHLRSKANIRDRLLFFLTRGPIIYRLTAMPKILLKMFRWLMRWMISR